MAKPKRHTKKKKGLGNPAAVAASTPAGQRAISQASETQRKLAETGISLIPWLVKMGLGAFVIWYLLGLWTKRFVKAKENPNYPPSNISEAQAKARADALYEAMYGFGANLEEVAVQLSGGINYNAWIKIYNAFGKRGSANLLGDDMDLVEWLHDQFDTDDLELLRGLIKNVF